MFYRIRSDTSLWYLQVMELSDGRIHKCDVCEKSFRKVAVLKRHLLLHSGEKPHKCAHCNKSFASRGNLKSHLESKIAKILPISMFLLAGFAHQGKPLGAWWGVDILVLLFSSIYYHHLLSFIEKLNKDYKLKEEYSFEFSLNVTFSGMEACPRNSSTPK